MQQQKKLWHWNSLAINDYKLKNEHFTNKWHDSGLYQQKDKSAFLNQLF